MRSLASFGLSLGFAVVAITASFAQPASPLATIDPQSLPAGHRFEGVRYETAREAHRFVTSQRGVVLIDVRTFEETNFNGVATVMRRHIPYLVADHRKCADDLMATSARVLA